MFSSVIVPDRFFGHFDMLRDKKRNKFYFQSVANLRPCEGGEEIFVDIGTGRYYRFLFVIVSSTN